MDKDNIQEEGSKIKNEEVKKMFKKIDKGIWESKKWKAKEITKNILIGLWTVTVFPFILLWMFITDNQNK